MGRQRWWAATGPLAFSLALLTARAAFAQEAPDPPATVSVFGLDLTPLLGPLLEVRDNVIHWKADFNAQMTLWLNDAVTYVGDRIGEAFMHIARGQLDALTRMDASFNLLTSIPLEWTVLSPVVWTMWGMMTAVFLAFAGPVLAREIGAVRQAKGKGALYDSHLHALTTTVLGAAMGLFSLAIASLGVLLVVAIAGFLLQGASALPGMPIARTPDAGIRNGALLFVYMLAASLIWFERLMAVAMVGFCLATSAWGIGGMFWPPARKFAGIWDALYTPTIVVVLMQILLFRLGSETVNLALAAGGSSDHTVVGMGVGLAYIVVAILSPGIIGAAYGAGAIPRFARTVSRAGTALTGINAARVVGAATSGATRRTATATARGAAGVP